MFVEKNVAFVTNTKNTQRPFQTISIPISLTMEALCVQHSSIEHAGIKLTTFSDSLKVIKGNRIDANYLYLLTWPRATLSGGGRTPVTFITLVDSFSSQKLASLTFNCCRKHCNRFYKVILE